MADIHFTTTLGGAPTDQGYFGILPGQTPMAPTPGGPFGPLLKAVVPVLSWLAPAVGLASALFPGAAAAIQGIGNIVGGLFGGAPNPAAPAAPVAQVMPPSGAFDPSYFPAGTVNPTVIPFDESSLLTSAFPTSGVGTGMIAIGQQLITRALPAIEAVVPKLLTRVPQLAALASAVYATYQGLRAQGQSHATAKRQALAAHGVRLRRRRMRVTNVRALRRAGRRVHGFQKLARKLGALPVAGRGRAIFAHHPRRFHRVHRRGDLSPFIVEDYEDMTDQLEDEGYDPTTFLPGDGYAAAGE